MKKKQGWKRMICSLAAGSMFALFCAGSSGTASAEESFYVTIPVNSGENSVGYTKYISDTEGPMGFFVDDGKAYILDSENERILIYSPDGYEGEIELGYYARRMALVEDEIYVVDYYQEKLVQYTKEGERGAEYTLGLYESGEVAGVTKVDGVLALISRSGSMNAYDPVVDEFCVGVGDSTRDVQVRTYEANRCTIREVTAELGDGCTMITSEIGADYLYLEKVITRTNADGEITGYYEVDIGSSVVFPEQTIYVGGGEVYLMHGGKDAVTVKQAEFQPDYDSKLPELCAQAREGVRNMMERSRQMFNPDKVNFELAVWDKTLRAGEYGSVASMVCGYSMGKHIGIEMGKVVGIER